MLYFTRVCVHVVDAPSVSLTLSTVSPKKTPNFVFCCLKACIAHIVHRDNNRVPRARGSNTWSDQV